MGEIFSFRNGINDKKIMIKITESLEYIIDAAYWCSQTFESNDWHTVDMVYGYKKFDIEWIEQYHMKNQYHDLTVLTERIFCFRNRKDEAMFKLTWG